MSNINNTSYRTVADTVETESGLSIEQGTLHVYNDELKVHLGGQIRSVQTNPVTLSGYLPTGFTSFDPVPLFDLNSATFVDITGSEVSVTLTVSSKIFATCTFNCTKSGGMGSTLLEFRVVNQLGTQIGKPNLVRITNANDYEIGSIKLLTDTLTPGTYTFKIQGRFVSGGNNGQIVSTELFVQGQQVIFSI